MMKDTHTHKKTITDKNMSWNERMDIMYMQREKKAEILSLGSSYFTISLYNS